MKRLAARCGSIVGEWDEIRSDQTAGLLERGPEASGVFARVSDLTASSLLDERGEVAGDAEGLLAATRNGEGPPTWIATGTDEDGVLGAVSAARHRRDRGPLCRRRLGRRRRAASGRGGRAVIAALTYVPRRTPARPSGRPGRKRLPGRVRRCGVRLLAPGRPCGGRARRRDCGAPGRDRACARRVRALCGLARRPHDRHERDRFAARRNGPGPGP